MVGWIGFSILVLNFQIGFNVSLLVLRILSFLAAYICVEIW